VALSATSFTYSAPVHLGVVLIIFGALMGLGALFAWVWLPDVQDPRDSQQTHTSLENGTRSNGNDERGGTASESGGQNAEENDQSIAGTDDTKESWLVRYKVPSKPLEELAEGWKKTIDRGQSLGFRRNIGIYDLLQPILLGIQKRLYKQEEGTEEQRQGLNGDWGEGDHEIER
jgi:hypothetical protein